MQLHCSSCKEMFVLSQEAALVGLHEVTHDENQQHYDARCPHCKRSNSIPIERIEKTFPNWQEDYEEMMKTAEENEKKHAALEKQRLEAKKKPVKAKKKRKPRR